MIEEDEQPMAGEPTLFTDNRITLDTVFVVESLRPGDRRTGEALFDEVFQPVGFRTGKDLDPKLRIVRDRVEFWAALQEVEAYAHAGGRPILHLEAHGSPTGLELGNRETVGWDEMMPLFRRVNELTGLNFIVTAAACFGFRAAFQALPLQPAPVRAIIGPAKEIPGDILECALRAFYRELFETSSLSSAVQAMKTAAPPRSEEMIIESAEHLFALAIHGYLRDHTSPRQVAQRKKEIIAEMRKRIPKGRRNVARRAAERELARQVPQRLFEDMMRIYFMHGRVPGAEQRFLVTWAEYHRWRDENLADLP